MRCCWLLLLLPNLCLVRIVQIEELVKKDKTYPVGTVIHETTGHVFQPDQVWRQADYKVQVAFRYRYGGVVREGRRQYIKLEVENLFLENRIAANRSKLHSSKGESLRRDAVVQSADIELLVPAVDGRAFFPFPLRVITPSTAENTEVTEAVLEVQGGRLNVREVAQKILPASKLKWTPPREWPKETQTIYLDATSDTNK